MHGNATGANILSSEHGGDRPIAMAPLAQPWCRRGSTRGSRSEAAPVAMSKGCSLVSPGGISLEQSLPRPHRPLWCNRMPWPFRRLSSQPVDGEEDMGTSQM